MKRNDTGIATKSIIDAVIDPVTWGEAAVLCVLAALGFGFLAFLCVLGGAGREEALAYFGGCVRHHRGHHPRLHRRLEAQLG